MWMQLSVKYCQSCLFSSDPVLNTVTPPFMEQQRHLWPPAFCALWHCSSKTSSVGLCFLSPAKLTRCPLVLYGIHGQAFCLSSKSRVFSESTSGQLTGCCRSAAARVFPWCLPWALPLGRSVESRYEPWIFQTVLNTHWLLVWILFWLLSPVHLSLPQVQCHFTSAVGSGPEHWVSCSCPVLSHTDEILIVHCGWLDWVVCSVGPV